MSNPSTTGTESDAEDQSTGLKVVDVTEETSPPKTEEAPPKTEDVSLGTEDASLKTEDVSSGTEDISSGGETIQKEANAEKANQSPSEEHSNVSANDAAIVNKENEIKALMQKDFLRYGAAAHPQLESLLKKLSLETVAKLKDPSLLTALTEAVSKEEVQNVLTHEEIWDANVPQEERTKAIEELAQENEKLQPLGNIANYAIAKMLAEGKTIPIAEVADNTTTYNPWSKETITQEKIEALNVFFLGPWMADYPITINRFVGSVVEDKHNIMHQVDCNNGLNLLYNKNTTSKKDKKLIAQIAALGKKEPFTEESAREIIKEINNSTTLKEFLTSTKYKEKFSPSLDEQLTQQQFSRWKTEARKAGLGDLAESKGPNFRFEYENELRELAEELSTIHNELNEIKLGSSEHKALTRLIDANPIYWIRPEFSQKVEKIKNLAVYCDQTKAHLESRKKYIAEQLEIIKKLPHYEKIKERNIVRRRIDSLQTLETEIEKELEIYKKAELLFHGDASKQTPVLKEGLLKTIAKKGAHEFKIINIGGVEVSHQDYSNDPENKHRKEPQPQSTADPKPASPSPLQVIVNDNKPDDKEDTLKNVQIIEPIPKGSFREYTVVNTDQKGSIETSKYIKEVENGKVTLTETLSPKSNEAKVNLAMEFARNVLCSVKSFPIKKGAIEIRGSEQEVLFKWTALMLIGKKNPELGINEKTIKTYHESAVKKELGWFGGFSNDSLAKQHFDQNSTCQDLLREISGLYKQKHNTAKLNKDTTEMTQFYKQRVGTSIPPIKPQTLSSDDHSVKPK